MKKSDSVLGPGNKSPQSNGAVGWSERTEPCGLSSDLHQCTMVCMHTREKCNY